MGGLGWEREGLGVEGGGLYIPARLEGFLGVGEGMKGKRLKIGIALF